MIDISLPYSSLVEIGNTLLQCDTVVLTTHIKPDGDAIGSTIGLATYLRAHGVEVRILLASQCPDNLLFLDQDHLLAVYDPSLHQAWLDSADCFVLLDANHPMRTEQIAEVLTAFPGITMVIDHHLDPQPFANMYYVDTLASSTSQIIAELIHAMGHSYQFDTAQALYTGILTDTGNFKFPRTTPDVHRLVARLIEAGVEPLTVYQNLYQQYTLAALRLTGRALSAMTVHHDGRLCIIPVRAHDFQETMTTQYDTEGLASYLLDIQGVVLGVLVTEIQTEGSTMIKLSVRSKGDISAQALAGHFGGGGHFNAAGGRTSTASFDDVIRDILTLSRGILTIENSENPNA